jgi:hypothetical protein
MELTRAFGLVWLSDVILKEIPEARSEWPATLGRKQRIERAKHEGMIASVIACVIRGHAVLGER